MEFIWIILVIVGWLISAAKKAEEKQQAQAKKQAQQARAQQARAQQPVSRPQPVAPAAPKHVPAAPASGGFSMPVPPMPASPTVSSPVQSAQPTSPTAFVSSHSAPLETHMHTPVMGEEGTGTEGVDCCHDYMLAPHEEGEPLDILSLNETDQTERAQALLQGVIFSEILGRRAVKRYGRRSA